MGKCMSKVDEFPEIMVILKTLLQFYNMYQPKVRYLDVPDEIDINLGRLETDVAYKDLMSYMSYLYFTSDLVKMKVRINMDGTQTYYYQRFKKDLN